MNRCIAVGMGLLGLFLYGCSSSNPPVFPADATLDEKIELTRQHLRLPGAVVAVVHDGEVLIDRAYGVAALGPEKTEAGGEAMTTGHRFRVASLTKPFVAAVMLRLVEEGQLGLDDPVGEYLDGIPGAGGETITLRMLAQHTSGLPNYVGLPGVKEELIAEPERRWTEEELLAFAYAGRPYFKPAEDGWMYSNTNYVLLGQVLEKVTGRGLDDLIQAYVCEPLGLTDTFYSVEASIPEPAARGYQYGDEDEPIFWKGRGEVPYDVTHASPSMWHAAGAMVSTLDDTRRFVEAIVKGELLGDEMHTAMLDFRDTGYPVDYSYGLGLINYYGAIGHTGNVPGYQVTATHNPEEDLTVVVLANCYSSPNYEEPANALFFVIHRHLTGRSVAPPGWEGW
ncbi:MAG: serine hydrolase domain-containing protein [Planctomycetota bacterium]